MKVKMTKQAADNLVSFAYEQQRNHPYMRLGQLIMNHLDVEVVVNLTWGDTNTPQTDFYYWEDNAKVLETFYKECVEG